MKKEVKKKIAVYPGSFDPWHQGHSDVLFKSLDVFDEIIVAKGWNPAKPESGKDIECNSFNLANFAKIKYFTGLFKDFIDSLPEKPCAIIKGLRNGQDFEYEKMQQYWNEDLGIQIPTFYVISDRKLVHISSSAIKAIKKIKGE